MIFPFLPVVSGSGASFLMPLLPAQLSYQGGEALVVNGLVDSGATINVLPFQLGLQLGATWDAQTTIIKLTGNLGGYEARALLVEATIGNFAAVRTAFAWTKAENVPVIFGQINFFQEFDVCLHRSRLVFEVKPATRT